MTESAYLQNEAHNAERLAKWASNLVDLERTPDDVEVYHRHYQKPQHLVIPPGNQRPIKVVELVLWKVAPV